MFKFFRNIRINLLAEGKIGKYLKYALGEIVLVVIGILIALGINNWNETRKAEEKTNQFLINLRSDLSNDLNEIEMVIKGQTERSNVMTEAIELSKDPYIKTIITQDSVKYYDGGRNVTFFPTVGSYNAASSAGLIDNIKDEALKNSILNLFEQLYVRVAHNGAILDERTGKLGWESRQYIEVTKKRYAFDKQGLLDQDFISQLGYLDRFIGFYLERCNNTKSGIEEVLKNINNYLNS